MKHVAAFTLMFLAVAGMVCGAAVRARAQGPDGEGNARDARNAVVIALTPHAVLDDTVVYLDQIAKLSGGPAALRQRLARLDVAEFKLGAERTVVSVDQVRFRLMLAGIAASQFQLGGAKQATVAESDDPLAARRILAIADKTIRFKNPNVGAPKEIIVPVLDLRPSDQVQLEAKVAAATTTHAARPRVNVAIIVNGKTREIVPVTFEDAPSYALARMDAAGQREKLIGAAKENGDVIIKSRDLVRIIAVVGNAHIVATGEAQQDGKLGEIIRVRNTESNRIVNGRIESRDVVTVDY